MEDIKPRTTRDLPSVLRLHKLLRRQLVALKYLDDRSAAYGFGVEERPERPGGEIKFESRRRQTSQRRQAPREKGTVVVEETGGPSPLFENVVVDGVEKHGLIRRKYRWMKKPGAGGRPIDILRDEGYSIEPDTIPGECYDVEAEVSSEDEVDDESPVPDMDRVDEELESEVEQERDGEGEDAMANELLGKYTTLFD